MVRKRNYKLFVIVMVAAMGMMACNSNMGRKREENKMQENTIENSSADEVQNFHNLMEADEVGDKKSVYWDGRKAILEEDELDDLNINDGRGMIEGTQTVTIPTVFEFTYTNSLKDVIVENNSEENYHIEAQNYDIRIELIDYEVETEKMASDANFAKITDSVLSERHTKYFKEYELYSGIVQTARGDYAGYSLIFDSAVDDRAYRITCSGIGCMENIRMEAFEIMNHFYVLFE